MRDVSAKRRRGEPLTAADREVLRQYHQRRDQASTHVYWDSPEQKARFQKVAEEQGARNFSKWVIVQVERSVKASPFTREEVQHLREQIDHANRRFEREAENGSYFREQAKKYERERDEAQEKLLKLGEELEDLRARMDALRAKPKGSKP
jgi:chromosome segregation ATPase